MVNIAILVQLRFWWQKIKIPPVLIGLITAGVLVIILIVGIIGGYIFNWDWTGFNGGYSQITTTSINQGTTITTVKPPGKTLWDLLQLFIIPVVITVGGLWFNQIQKDREQRATEQRVKTERDTEEQRAKTEREIAEDNQCETALQEYIDKMSELLLHEKLRNSAEEDEVRVIARVRTMTILPRLDATRKSSVLLFLHESGLIEKGKYIIDLSAANLGGANLRRDNLSAANLRRTYLGGANLREADLSGADLSGANLHDAILWGTNLSFANLNGADLLRSDLSEANLRGANMTNAVVNTEQLKQALFLNGATMPDGTKHA